jgi:hypothetical protein
MAGPWTLPLAILGVGIIGLWLVGGKKSATAAPDRMPQLNSATRGQTIAVTFGTVGIMPQVTWTKNFNPVPNANGGKKGGKGGGSGGMGSAKGASQGSGQYEYYWDMVFDYGIMDVPCTIRRMWIGGDPMDSLVVSALTLGDSDLVIRSFPISVINPSVKQAKLSYTGSFLAPGYNTGDSNLTSWAYKDAQQGGVVQAWPSHFWLGFEQLDLGSSPSVPQLKTEVVPLAALSSFNGDNPNFIGRSPHNSSGDDIFNQPFCVDDHGVYWVIQSQTSGASPGLSVAKLDGTVGGTVTSAQWASDCAALSLGSTTLATIFGVPYTKYCYIAGFSLAARWVGVLYEINTDGTITRLGGFDYAGINGFYNGGVPRCVALDVTTGMPFVVGTTLGGYTAIFAYPAPSALASGATIVDGTTVTTAKCQIIIAEFGSGGTHTFFGVAYSVTNTDLRAGVATLPNVNRIFLYLSKEVMQWSIANPYPAANSNIYIDSVASTYPNGAMVEVDWVYNSPYTLIGVNNSYFRNSDGTNAIPFSDVQLTLAGTAGVAYDDYNSPLISDDGTMMIFGRSYSDNYNKVGVRIFAFSPLGDYATQIAKFPGLYGSDSQLGGHPSQQPFDGVVIMNNANIYFSGIYGNGATDHANAIIGAPTPSAMDVTPPYIIYRILTSAVYGFATSALYGFTVTTDRIDSASYAAAVQYCEDQGIFLSVSYSNQDSLLNILNELLEWYGGFLTNNDGMIQFGYVSGTYTTTPRVIDNSHLVAQSGKPPVSCTKASIDDCYNIIQLNYLDRDLGYNQNQVQVEDPVDCDINGPRVKTYNARYVMTGSVAMLLANRALWANMYAKDQYSFTLGWKDADLTVGDPITLVDSFDPLLSTGVIARIIDMRPGQTRGKFDATAVREQPYIIQASIGYTRTSCIDLGTRGAIDSPRAPVFQTEYEMPLEFQSTKTFVYFAYATDFRAMGAQLFISTDGVNYPQVQDVQPYLLAGKLAAPLPARSKGWREEKIEFYVFPSGSFSVATPSYYQDVTLDDITEAIRTAGGGTFVCGSEAMAFENLTLLGQNHYRAAYCYRGWGGSPISSHSSGDYITQHGPGVIAQEIRQDDVGKKFSYKIAPYNFAGETYNLSSIQPHSYQVLGFYWLPREFANMQIKVPSARAWSSNSPITGQWIAVASGGCDADLRWSMSDNVEGYGAGGYGAGSFGHFIMSDSVGWRVDVSSKNGTAVSSFVVNTNAFNYTLNQNSADFSGVAKDLIFKVTPFTVKGDCPITDVRSFSMIW